MGAYAPIYTVIIYSLLYTAPRIHLDMWSGVQSPVCYSMSPVHMYRLVPPLGTVY